jgi:hypothetical protein
MLSGKYASLKFQKDPGLNQRFEIGFLQSQYVLQHAVHGDLAYVRYLSSTLGFGF